MFVIAFLLVYVFALTLGWFPTEGYVPLSQGILACLHSLILPGVALALLYASLLARVTRASLLEVLSEDLTYVRRTPRGRCPRASPSATRSAMPRTDRHGDWHRDGRAARRRGRDRNRVQYSGLGRLATDAIQRRDYPVVQGLILVFSSVYVVINLLVDLNYVLFDPRVRY